MVVEEEEEVITLCNSTLHVAGNFFVISLYPPIISRMKILENNWESLQTLSTDTFFLNIFLKK